MKKRPTKTRIALPTLRAIFDQIERERAVQDRTWGEVTDNSNSTLDWVAVINTHACLGLKKGVGVGSWSPGLDHFRSQMVRVAALAVAAIQATDRRTESRAARNVPRGNRARSDR